MNKPKLFLEYEDKTIRDTRALLTKYFPLIRGGTNAEKRALDIGCGPGNVTHNILLPFLQQDIDEIVGIDIASEMIEYAKSNYGNDRLTFKQIDVIDSVPNEFMAHFDYVFSFWTLQWFKDQRKLFSNILKMLKPNGELLVTFIAKSTLFDIYQLVWKKEQWARYIPNFDLGISPYQDSQNPEEDLLTIFKDVGYEMYLCRIEQASPTYFTAADLHGILVSLIPVYDQIPKNLQEEFVLDHVKEVSTLDVAETEEKYYFDIDLFVAHARKSND